MKSKRETKKVLPPVVTVRGIKAKRGQKQVLEIGKEYPNIGLEHAKQLVELGRAEIVE